MKWSSSFFFQWGLWEQYHQQIKTTTTFFLLPMLTPYLSQLFKISLMNKFNKKGDNGQTCLTPWWIGNSFDNKVSSSSFRSKIELRNEIKTFVAYTEVKDFFKNVENGNRVIGFFQIKKSYICKFTFKFPITITSGITIFTMFFPIEGDTSFKGMIFRIK